jgi:hypothetical protein
MDSMATRGMNDTNANCCKEGLLALCGTLQHQLQRACDWRIDLHSAIEPLACLRRIADGVHDHEALIELCRTVLLQLRLFQQLANGLGLTLQLSTDT